ncbi:MAG: hypothetical protein ABI691_19810 [Ginsengibacter sp.]
MRSNPAIIAIGFLLLSWAMLEINFSPWGKHDIDSGVYIPALSIYLLIF